MDGAQNFWCARRVDRTGSYQRVDDFGRQHVGFFRVRDRKSTSGNKVLKRGCVNRSLSSPLRGRYGRFGELVLGERPRLMAPSSKRIFHQQIDHRAFGVTVKSSSQSFPVAPFKPMRKIISRALEGTGIVFVTVVQSSVPFQGPSRL